MNEFKIINGNEGTLYLLRKANNCNYNYNGTIYHLIVIQKFENDSFLNYNVFDGLIPLHPSKYYDDKALESIIFRRGRSKSYHENIIYIYENFKEKFSIKCSKDTFISVESFNNYFLSKYKLNINYILGGYTYKKRYVKRLYTDLINLNEIKDINYDKNCYSTMSSLEFFNELKKLINIGEILSVDWFSLNNNVVVHLKFKNKIICLHGLNAGYFGEGSRGLMYIIKECGFSSDDAKKVLSTTTYSLRKQMNRSVS